MKKLEDTFQKLGFEVIEPYENLDAIDLICTVEEWSQYDFKEYGCLVVCLLSHGIENAIECKDGERVNINKLKYEFVLNKCPSLYGKPKIFIVQACQGELEQDETGIVVLREKRAKKRSRSSSRILPAIVQMSSKEAKARPKTLPVKNKSNNPPIMDLFTMKATIPGFVSYRDTETGSYFIQALCEKMEDEYCTKTIETLPRARPLQNILYDVQKIMHENQTPMSEDYVTKFIKFCRPIQNSPTI